MHIKPGEFAAANEKSGILNGKKFTQRGHKLFQFIKIDQIWKISTVIWEDNEN